LKAGEFVRKREYISQKGDAVYGFSSQLVDSSIGDSLSHPWHEPCLTDALVANLKQKNAHTTRLLDFRRYIRSPLGCSGACNYSKYVSTMKISLVTKIPLIVSITLLGLASIACAASEKKDEHKPSGHKTASQPTQKGTIQKAVGHKAVPDI